LVKKIPNIFLTENQRFAKNDKKVGMAWNGFWHYKAVRTLKLSFELKKKRMK